MKKLKKALAKLESEVKALDNQIEIQKLLEMRMIKFSKILENRIKQKNI
jgi:hypothetical protein